MKTRLLIKSKKQVRIMERNKKYYVEYNLGGGSYFIIKVTEDIDQAKTAYKEQVIKVAKSLMKIEGKYYKKRIK